MTILTGGIAILIALLLSTVSLGVARGVALQARAQSAADAAALAAVAESVTFGSGTHRYQARRFAELNGAELVSCLCFDGATAAQVEVDLHGIRARARAVLDADLLMPLGAARGLHPTVARAVAVLVERSAGAVRVASGYRSPAQQRELWREALVRYGDPEQADDWVARPGTSMHEAGLAVDLSGDLRLADRLIAEMGLPLRRTVAHEAWHYELIGSRSSAPV